MNRDLRHDLLSGLVGFAATALLLAGAAAASAQASDPGFKPGLWSLERTMRGGPGGRGRDVAEEVCFDSATLARDPAAPLRMRPPAGEANAPQCVIADLGAADGKASYAAACKGPMGTIRGNWAGTYDAEHFAMTGKMKFGFFSMTARYSGRRVGDCKR